MDLRAQGAARPGPGHARRRMQRVRRKRRRRKLHMGSFVTSGPPLPRCHCACVLCVRALTCTYVSGVLRLPGGAARRHQAGAPAGQYHCWTTSFDPSHPHPGGSTWRLVRLRILLHAPDHGRQPAGWLARRTLQPRRPHFRQQPPHTTISTDCGVRGACPPSCQLGCVHAHGRRDARHTHVCVCVHACACVCTRVHACACAPTAH